jgi:hypothetical protein
VSVPILLKEHDSLSVALPKGIHARSLADYGEKTLTFTLERETKNTIRKKLTVKTDYKYWTGNKGDGYETIPSGGEARL